MGSNKDELKESVKGTDIIFDNDRSNQKIFGKHYTPKPRLQIQSNEDIESDQQVGFSNLEAAKQESMSLESFKTAESTSIDKNIKQNIKNTYTLYRLYDYLVSGGDRSYVSANTKEFITNPNIAPHVKDIVQNPVKEAQGLFYYTKDYRKNLWGQESKKHLATTALFVVTCAGSRVYTFASKHKMKIFVGIYGAYLGSLFAMDALMGQKETAEMVSYEVGQAQVTTAISAGLIVIADLFVDIVVLGFAGKMISGLPYAGTSLGKAIYYRNEKGYNALGGGEVVTYDKNSPDLSKLKNNSVLQKRLQKFIENDYDKVWKALSDSQRFKTVNNIHDWIKSAFENLRKNAELTSRDYQSIFDLIYVLNAVKEKDPEGYYYNLHKDLVDAIYGVDLPLKPSKEAKDAAHRVRSGLWMIPLSEHVKETIPWGSIVVCVGVGAGLYFVEQSGIPVLSDGAHEVNELFETITHYMIEPLKLEDLIEHLAQNGELSKVIAKDITELFVIFSQGLHFGLILKPSYDVVKASFTDVNKQKSYWDIVTKGKEYFVDAFTSAANWVASWLPDRPTSQCKNPCAAYSIELNCCK